MKIVVIGGSGLIGWHLTAELSHMGHEAIPASRSTGVNVLTGEELTGAVAGADVVVAAPRNAVVEIAGPECGHSAISSRSASGPPATSGRFWPIRERDTSERGWKKGR